MGNVVRIGAGERPIEGRTSGTLHTPDAVASEDERVDVRPTGGHSRLVMANDVAGGSLTTATQQPALARLALQPGVALAGVVGTNAAALLFAAQATGNCFRCIDWHTPHGTYRDVHVLALDVSPQAFVVGVDVALVLFGVWLLGRLPIIRQLDLHLSERQIRGVRELLLTSLLAGIVEFATIAQDGSTWDQAFNSKLIVANVLAFVLSLFVAAWRVRGGRLPRIWLEVGWRRAGRQAALPQAAKRQE